MNERLVQLKRKIPFWGRIVMNREIDAFLKTLPAPTIEAIEISGWAHGERGFRSYRALHYPEFDICTDRPLAPEADIVFCEQVLEHTQDPWRAVRNIRALLRPGGHAVISVPFMVRVHNEPGDYWRFTAAGLRLLVESAGLQVVALGDWGSRASVIANLWFWCPYLPGLPLWRSAAVPLVVWTIARAPEAVA